MPARVCDTCEIAYPTLIVECRVCDAALRYVSNRTPSEWEAESLELLDRQRLGRAIPLVRCGTVRDEHGRRWLYRRDLRSAGYVSPVASFQLFDTLDGIVEVQGYDALHARWWIERVIVDA